MLLLACRRVVLSLAVGAAAAALSVLPASAADPAQLIQSTATEVIEIIKKTTPEPARQADIQRVLQTNFDLPYMGQQALGANWNKASEAERTRRELRQQVEQALRKVSSVDGASPGAGLSDAQIALCFEYAAEDSPIDLDKLLPEIQVAVRKAESKKP